MFNICYPASDPVNPSDIRFSNFAPLELAFDHTDVREFQEFSSGSYLATSGIQRELLEEGISSR